MVSPMMKRLALALFTVTLSSPAAFAATSTGCGGNCRAQVNDIDRIARMPTPQKPGGGVIQRRDGTAVSGAQATYIRDQIAAAARACREGNDARSAAHINKVRELLDLPAGNA